MSTINIADLDGQVHEIDLDHIGNRALHMDCMELMRALPDKCIDLTVTSPPYDNLREYNGNIKQWSFEKFKSIAKELYRITKAGGVVVWVVADATINGSETGTSFKQALWFMDCGFNLHDTMIWVKDGGGAVGSNKCYTQNHEYMFVFSKENINSYNLIKDKPNLSYGIDKSGVGRRLTTGEHKVEQRKAAQEFSRRNNWWYIPTESGDHPAVYPLKLATDHIISWSNKNDIVFDCFLGSGTTRISAWETERQFLGCEIDADYFKAQEERYASYASQLKLF